MLASTSCSQPAERSEEPAPQPANAAQSAPPAAKLQAATLTLDASGLIVGDEQGARRKIAFDGPASAAIDAARQLYGEPEAVETLEECGAGPLQISKFPGLTLAAQEGKFVGWWLDDNPKPPLPATAAGIGMGSTREALEKAYSIEAFESTIGHEFSADGIAGVTDSPGKTGKVTHLWAGATCIMR